MYRFRNLVLPARPEGALRHFFQDIVDANGFDDLFLGLVAVVFIVGAFVAKRCGGLLGVFRGGGLVAFVFGAAVFGVRGVVGMNGVFARVGFVGQFITRRVFRHLPGRPPFLGGTRG